MFQMMDPWSCQLHCSFHRISAEKARKKEEREKENEDRRRKQKEQDRAEEEEHRSAGRVLRLGIHGFPARKGNNHTVMMIAEIHLDTEQRVNGVEWIHVGKKGPIWFWQAPKGCVS